MIGKTISHYKIIEKLGQGGMGAVYKAKDTKLDRFVALKFLPPHLSQAEAEKKRFIHEAKAASALDHPNICSIYEINETEPAPGEQGGRMFIAMACYEGESLKDRIANGPLPLEEAMKITTQIAKGLEKAHTKEIVHRDIKPANILITEDGVVKIVDFGLAKLAGQTKLTKTGSTLGTVAYMSPEQAQGTEVDERTDIWAFGVILYEMLAGKPPFTGEYEQAVLYSILNEDPKPITDLRSDIPETLEQIVSRALEKDPEKRYQHIKELLDDLESLSAGIVPEKIKFRMRKAKLRKRRKTILYTTAAVCIIGISATLILLSRKARTIDSIAVLPLKNLTGNVEQEYFVDGITDELIGELGHISGLKRVISRTSVMQYKDTDKALPDIARELNVDVFVEGTVYQVGDSIRVRFQLIDVLPEEKNLWGETYTQPMREVLMMYSEVAQVVAREIKVGLTQQEKTRFSATGQINPEVYELYLKGMSHVYKLTPPELDAALHYFEKALEIDPDYALAYMGISLVWGVRQQMGLIMPSESTPKVKAAAQKALELNDMLPEVQYQWANIRTWIDWDWEGGEQAFKRALELKPNFAEAFVYYSNLLCYMGRLDEALAMADRAMQLDPLNSIILTISGSVYEYLRRYDDVIELANKALQTSPNDPLGYNMKWGAYYKKEMYEESLESAKAFFTSLGLADIADVMDQGYEESGYSGAMRFAAETMAAFSKQTYISPYFIAVIYLFAGDEENTIDWLEKGYEMRDPNMPYIGNYAFDLVYDDPRYQDLLRKMNLPVGEMK